MTATTTAAELIPELVERIVRHCDPLEIVLFGSHARGDARPDSDIDLLVVLPRIDDRTATTIDLLRLFGDLTVSVDVIAATPEDVAGERPGSVAGPAYRAGRSLYAR